jgi:glucose/arabinose dehydrogenase
MHSRTTLAAAAAALAIGLGACKDMDQPTGPAATAVEGNRAQSNGFGAVSNVTLPPGYFLVPVAKGLDFPTAVASSASDIWVAEAGATPGATPKIKHVEPDGQATTILDGAAMGSRLLGPLTDVTFHDGWLWIAHRQTGVNGWAVGAISKFRPEDPMGTFTTVLTGLPSAGDHYTEEVVFGSDGRAYFSQGTATNSSVVGADNWLITGWLQQAPTFHDFPAKDVVLNGKSYQTAAAFPLDPDASKITAPFMPFGSGAVAPGTVVQGVPRDGIVAGNGTVYSFDASAGDASGSLRLEAWGFRNPYGIGFDPFEPDVLFASNNGADTRGVAGETTVPIDEEDLTIVESRPIDEDFDDLFQLHVGGTEEFFGFPDFFHDEESGEVEPVTDEEFCEELDPCPEFVLDAAFRQSLHVEPAVTELGYHTSANKFDFSTSHQFKHEGEVFVAETGSFVPTTGATEFTGYKVVRVDRSGNVSDFIVHPSQTQSVIFDPDGFNKPIDVKFDGDAMLVVDFGVFEPGLGIVQQNSGKLWAVCHGAAACKKLGR